MPTWPQFEAFATNWWTVNGVGLVTKGLIAYGAYLGLHADATTANQIAGGVLVVIPVVLDALHDLWASKVDQRPHIG